MQRLGKYEIIEKIGEGGFGTVYKARDTSPLDRIVALKVLKQALLADPVFLERFHREAKAAAALEHPHIVSIYEVGEEQGTHYIAMRYLAGESLDKLISREGALLFDRALNIARQIAEALDYAHSRDMIHRDVKPSNMIVAENDSATLTDFGLVRSMEGSMISSGQQIVGTAEYMAPEQLDTDRAGEVGARSDLYAFGIVVYQMLTGRVPFSGTTSAVIGSQLYKAPPLPSDFRRDLPPAMETAILKMLAKDSRERFAGASEFVNALSAEFSAAALVPTPLPSEPEVPIRIIPQPERESEPLIHRAIQPARKSSITPMLILAGVAGTIVLLIVVATIAIGANSNRPVALALTATPTLIATTVPIVIQSMTIAPTMTLIPTIVSTAIPSTVPIAKSTNVPTSTPVVIVVTATSIPPTTTPLPTATPVGPQKKLEFKDGLQIIDLTTGKVSSVSATGDISAAWSKDGTKVLVVNLEKSTESSPPWCYDSTAGHRCEPRAPVDVFQGKLSVLDFGNSPSSNFNGNMRDAIWSSDERKIAVWNVASNQQYCPSIMDSNGNGIGRMQNCDGDDFPRYWSVDGKWVISRNRNQNQRLYAYEVDGTRRVPLEQLGKLQVYDERYWPWKVIDSPVCKGADFWSCE